MSGAAVDILARLKLAGGNFSRDFKTQMDGVEREARRAASRTNLAFRGIGSSLQGELQQATARVPVLGAALGGLSGPALIAAGGVGAIVAVLGKGISEAEALAKAVRQLDAVTADGANKTGLSRQQLIDYSEQIEGSLAIAQEEVVKAMAVLAQYDNVSGATFKRAIQNAGDLSAVFGGDLASNSEKLGTVLQNLANGDVEGLSRGFKFLGTETLDAVEKLAKAGRESEAAELLLAKLEERIGKAGEANAKGVTGALFRMTDALSDSARVFAERTGIYDGFAATLDRIASGAEAATSKMKEMNGIEISGSLMAWLSEQTGGGAGPFGAAGIVGLGIIGATGAGGKKKGALDPWTPDQWQEWQARVQAEADASKADRERKTRNARERAEEDRKAGLISFGSPVDGTISSGFGPRSRPGGIGSRYHLGIDYAVPSGTAVRAPATGVVEVVGFSQDLGKYVVIDHGGGTKTRFGHLSGASVKAGQMVDRGEVFARSGNTGRKATGPHLHYEVYEGGKPVDPRRGKFKTEPGGALSEAEERSARAAEQAAEKAGREAEQRRKQQEQILATMREQFNLEIEGARYAAMRATGLDREADLAEKLAEIRLRTEEQLAQLSPERQEVERKVNEEAQALIDLYAEQAASLAELIEANGERGDRTREQVAAEEAVRQAMDAALVDAYSLAKTTEERARLVQAIVKAEQGYANAVEDGAKAAQRQKKEDEEAQQRYVQMLEERRDAQERQFQELADFWEQAFRSGGKSVWEDFKDEGYRVLGQLAAQWTMQLLSGQKLSLPGALSQMGAVSGAGGGDFDILSLFGMGGGGRISDAAARAPGGGFGGGNPGTRMAELERVVSGLQDPGAAGAAGSMGGLMGSIGQAAPMMAAAMAATSMISSVLGIKNHAGGAFGVLGNLVINAVTPAKRGSATLGFDQYGGLAVTSTRGNSKTRVSAASDAGGSIVDALQRVADQLGGSLTGAPSVSIGMRDKSWRVDTTGRGITKTKNGAKDFGEDQEAAIRYAIGDALKDGVIAGISDASKRILASGQDLERAIEKAVLVESIPDRLAAYLDPVGAQLDELNERWEKTIAALREGGASAEEMAKAQQLYKLELQETKAAAREASAELKDFLAGIAFGSASPYSLRDQEQKAFEALKPFLDQIDAKERIDQGQYTAAASAYLQIERALGGSTSAFFDKLSMVQDYTNRAIAEIDNAKPIRTYADPFAEKTASNTLASAEILGDIRDRTANAEALLGRILSAVSGGGSDFVGAARGFVRANNALL